MQFKFDLQKALNGAKVVTRAGQKVIEIKCFDEPEALNNFPLFALIDDGHIRQYNKEGSFFADGEMSAYDLFIEVETVVKWYNVYNDCEIGRSYDSIHTAMQGAASATDATTVRLLKIVFNKETGEPLSCGIEKYTELEMESINDLKSKKHNYDSEGI